MIRRGSMFATVVMFAACCVAIADETYPVKLNRAFQAGTTFKIEGRAATKQSQEMTMGDQAPQSMGESRSMTLEGEITIDQVDGDGHATKATLKVAKCTMTTDDGEPVEAIAPDTEVTVTIDGKERNMAAGDTELSPEVIDLLGNILPVDPDRADADAMFGTTEPRKAGDSWTVNAEKVATDIGGRMGAPIEAKNVKGTTTFVGIEEVGGVRCMDVNVEVEIVDLPVEDPSVEVEESKISIRVVYAVPVDAAMPALGHAGGMALHMVLKGDNEGTTVHVTKTMEMMGGTQLTPVAK